MGFTVPACEIESNCQRSDANGHIEQQNNRITEVVDLTCKELCNYDRAQTQKWPCCQWDGYGITATPKFLKANIRKSDDHGCECPSLAVPTDPRQKVQRS